MDAASKANRRQTEQGSVHQGDLVVTENLVLYGFVTGSVTVEAGAAVELYAMVDHDLVVKPGAVVDMQGYIKGSVYNQGGELRISGTVAGQVHRQGGQTTVDPNAVVIGGLQ